MQLTEDDLAILQHVYRHRLIDSAMLYELFPARSRQHLSRRLKTLFEAHYVGRPPQQIERFRPGGGSEHLVYGLDREGAKVLREHLGVRVPVEHWLQKNREVKRRSIEHVLSTTRFMVSLEVALRAYPHIRLIPFEEIIGTLAPERTRRKPQPMRFRVPVEWQSRTSEEGIAPDRVFGLEHADRPAGKNRAFYFLEIDEGTETIEPSERVWRSQSFFRQSSILRKLIVYAYAHRARVHEQHFGIPVFRVLTVTTTATRVEAMTRTFERHLRRQPLLTKPGLFLFANRQKLQTNTSYILSQPWKTGLGREVYLHGNSALPPSGIDVQNRLGDA